MLLLRTMSVAWQDGWRLRAQLLGRVAGSCSACASCSLCRDASESGQQRRTLQGGRAQRAISVGAQQRQHRRKIRQHDVRSQRSGCEAGQAHPRAQVYAAPAGQLGPGQGALACILQADTGR